MAIIHKDIDHQTGIITKVHDIGNKVSIEKTYDAQPILEHAKTLRDLTDGEKWGDFRQIGTIPMAELATMMRQSDNQVSKKELEKWLKKNPQYVTFNKFLKTGAKG